jgi:hypothetical protein
MKLGKESRRKRCEKKKWWCRDICNRDMNVDPGVKLVVVRLSLQVSSQRFLIHAASSEQ